MTAITKSQYEAIKDSAFYGFDDFHSVLREYTDIVAKPYTAYSYYDDDGNYLGDSGDLDIDDLLKAAYIEVVGE